MINPYKNTELINSYYVDSETKSTLIPERDMTLISKKCQPDMNWIYNDCMMKSEDFRNLLEKNHKINYFICDPFIKKHPQMLKRYKKRLTNPTDSFNYYDPKAMVPAFNNCSLMYQDLCRNFYENKSLSEEFRI